MDTEVGQDRAYLSAVGKVTDLLVVPLVEGKVTDQLVEHLVVVHKVLEGSGSSLLHMHKGYNLLVLVVRSRDMAELDKVTQLALVVGSQQAVADVLLPLVVVLLPLVVVVLPLVVELLPLVVLLLLVVVAELQVP